MAHNYTNGHLTTQDQDFVVCDFFPWKKKKKIKKNINKESQTAD